MGIKTYDELGKIPPPLTPEEIADFENGVEGCMDLTADFRFDLQQKRDSAFNLEAIRIAAEDLLTRIQRDGWYKQHKHPAIFLDQEYIELLMYNHLQYVKTLYRKIVLFPCAETRDQERQAAARSSRKSRVGSFLLRNFMVN